MLKFTMTLALFALSAVTPLKALDMPKGTPVIAITGNVTETNSDGQAVFDREMLEALPGREAKMETPWTEGQVTFSGPYLRSVLEAAGAKGTRLVVHALNDYSAEVPFEDGKLDTILAVRMNGAEMSVRDKGPTWIIYPFDLNHDLYNERYFTRSVWQIKSIEVLD